MPKKTEATPAPKKKPTKSKGPSATKLTVIAREHPLGGARERIEVRRLGKDLTVVTGHARLYLMDNGDLGPPVMYPMRDGMSGDHPTQPRWRAQDVLVSGSRLVAVWTDQITFVDIATRSVEPPALTAPDEREWRPIAMDDRGLLLMATDNAAVARVGLDGSTAIVDERESEGEVHSLGDRVVLLRSDGQLARATIFDTKLAPRELAPIAAETTGDDKRWVPRLAAVRGGEPPVIVMPGTGAEVAVWWGAEAKHVAMPFRVWDVALGDRAFFGRDISYEVVRMELDGSVRWRSKPPSTWSTRGVKLLVCGERVVSVLTDAIHLLDIETGAIVHSPKIPLAKGEVIGEVFELDDSIVAIPKAQAKVPTKAYRVLVDGTVQTLAHVGVDGACRGDSSCAFMTWSVGDKGGVETVLERWQ